MNTILTTKQYFLITWKLNFIKSYGEELGCTIYSFSINWGGYLHFPANFDFTDTLL